jgi:hypothetical protein
MRTSLAVMLSLPFLVSAETLHYSVNWASGLSLGEAALTSTRVSADAEGGEVGGWKFSVTLDAAVPGFTIRDEYTSKTDLKLCTSEVKKKVTRGTRKTGETIEIDSQTNIVTRRTDDSDGKSEYSVSTCAHDAMAFLQFVRQELAQGRVAPQQSVVLGAKYDVHLTFTGTETIRFGGENVTTDRVKTVIKGPKADITLDLFFMQDDVRTPVLARLPLELGTFTLELLP